MISAQLSGRIVILANPAAGGGDGGALSHFASALAGSERQVEVIKSAGPGDLRRLAHEVVADYLFVAGGDGSINEVVDGLLARERPRPVLGIVPQGTVNVLAAELGLPREPGALARAYFANRVGRLCLGLANERPFLLMASAGLDAEVVHALRQDLKRIIGRAAYLVEAVRRIRRNATPLEIETDSGTFHARLAIFSNASRYGGDFIIAPDMNVLQPGLRMIVLRDVTLPSLLRLGYFMLRGDIAASGLLETVALRRATVRAATPVATQVDGEALGITPLLLREADEALDILLPPEEPEK